MSWCHLHWPGIRITCLQGLSYSVSSNIQVAASEMLHILTNFYINIMPLDLPEIHTLYCPMIGNSNVADTKVNGWCNIAPLLQCGTLLSHRRHINHSNKFFNFLRSTYAHTCDTCNKSLRISLQLNDLLHTPHVHGHSLQHMHL
jgi:hypothetical protein